LLKVRLDRAHRTPEITVGDRLDFKDLYPTVAGIVICCGGDFPQWTMVSDRRAPSIGSRPQHPLSDLAIRRSVINVRDTIGEDVPINMLTSGIDTQQTISPFTRILIESKICRQTVGGLLSPGLLAIGAGRRFGRCRWATAPMIEVARALDSLIR